MTIPQIIITGPEKADLDSQTSTDNQPPRLWIAGVQITTPCQTLQEATRSVEFLLALEELARLQRQRVIQDAEALRQRQILDEPETATEEEFESAVAREFAPPRYVVFYHHADGPTQPRTAWAWGSDLVTHYNADGQEVGTGSVGEI